MKKTAAFILALLLIVPLCISCVNQGSGDNTTAGASPNETTSDGNYDANGYIKDRLPELNFNKEEVTILMWSDFTMKEFYDDSESGDFIGEAINARNTKVQDRLGVTLKFIETPGNSSHMTEYKDKVMADAQVSPSEYDIFATYSRTPPALSLEGLCANLLETDYFDIEMPWWPDALTNECTINNKLYYCSGDISTNLLWMMIATFFNQKMIKNYQNIEKDPYQLVESNEWTFDKMTELTKDIYEDLSGNGKTADDRFGFVIYETNIDAFQTGAGITSIAKDDTGAMTISPDFTGERQIDMVSKVANFMQSDDVYHSSKTSTRDIFFEERSLMITDRVFIVAGKDQGASTNRIEFEYGIVPQPKYSADQEKYTTNVGHPFTMYAIASYLDEDTINMCSAVLEAMGSENYRSITPKVFETAMKVRYATDSVAGKMYDTIRGGISFDIGRLYASAFGNHTSNLFRKAALEPAVSYSSRYESAKSAIETGLATIAKSFE